MLCRGKVSADNRLLQTVLEDVDRVIFITKEGVELEVDLTGSAPLDKAGFVRLFNNRAPVAGPSFKVISGAYSFEPASGETAEFHGETAVLLTDAILTNCYSGMTDSIGRITWTNLPEKIASARRYRHCPTGIRRKNDSICPNRRYTNGPLRRASV